MSASCCGSSRTATRRRGGSTRPILPGGGGLVEHRGWLASGERTPYSGRWSPVARQQQDSLLPTSNCASAANWRRSPSPGPAVSTTVPSSRVAPWRTDFDDNLSTAAGVLRRVGEDADREGQAVRGLLRGVPADRPVSGPSASTPSGRGRTGPTARSACRTPASIWSPASAARASSSRSSASSTRRPRRLAWEHVSTFVAMLSQDVFSSGMLISTAGSESVELAQEPGSDLEGPSRSGPRRELRGIPGRLEPVPTVETPPSSACADRKTLRPHQVEAIADVRDRVRRRRRPGPDDHGVRDRQDVHVAAARRAARRCRRIGVVPGAVDQPAVADGDRVGERREVPLRRSPCAPIVTPASGPRATRTCPRTTCRCRPRPMSSRS